MSHPTFSGAVSLAVHMAVSLAVHMAVSLAVYTAVQMTVSLAVHMAVSLAMQMAVSLAVQMGQMKKMLNLSGKPSFTPTVVRGATSNSMRCSRFSLSQSFALRLCFTEANPTTTLLLMRTATATSPPSCYLTKASLACKAPAQILEVITTPNLLADADRHCLLVRCLSALNHAPIAHQCRCATAGAPR
jgi:hypothetical protein